MIDGHIHLENGPLTKEYVLLFVEEAHKKGLDAIQILDHTHRFIEFEPIYEELKQYPVQKKWLENKEMKFKDHLITFIELMEEIKEMDLPVQVTYGLEVCYVPHHEEKIKEILSQYHFDFIVGAIHSIEGILYDMSFSRELLWDVYDVNDIYQRYYELVFQLIQSDLFTQLAHPDTIKIFEIYPSYDLKSTYEKLSQLLNEHHMKAENNVGCFYRYHHPDVGLSEELLKIFKQNHVEMITASDAHHPSDVGSYIVQASQRIKD
jgi:Histidinol phosphatase and related hydrolases of the PHP family